RQLLLQSKAGRESGLIPSGHAVVNTRLRAQFDEAGWVREQISGVSNLFFLRQLAAQVDADWPAVLAKLEEIRRHLVNRARLTANVTVDAASWQMVAPRLEAFLAALPAAPVAERPWQPPLAPANEGLTVPAQVNYVAKGANLVDLGYRPHGSVAVIANILRTTYLWEKIRVQGGAYGAFNAFDRRSGVWSFLSYRDPNLRATLDTYDATADFLRSLHLPDDELTKGIIGAISQLDAYQLPDARGYAALVRHLLGETDADRQQYRDEVLGTTPADFAAFADVLAGVQAHGQVVVMGSADAIAAANPDGWLQVSKVL
ncbi:MAG: peptidase M16, partial [Anaerolineales bacterium]|nr:peptidase M16 [Anaerolineales bacterium]